MPYTKPDNYHLTFAEASMREKYYAKVLKQQSERQKAIAKRKG